jgi:pimeloyl-ACP methyl ester carboxylesterase
LCWGLQSRYFAYHGWNVLAVDLPGHGRSGGGALPSVAAIADWIPSMLDAAGVGKAALVGHSLGALAMLEWWRGIRTASRSSRSPVPRRR